MKEENLDYKKACEEAINSLEEEFKNGAKAMLSFIQREANGCLGLSCNCIVCEAGKKFLRQRPKIKSEEENKMKKLSIAILGILLIASVSGLLMPILITPHNYEQEQKVTEIPNLLQMVNQIINDTYWTQYYLLYKPKPKYRGSGGNSPPVEPQTEEPKPKIGDINGDGLVTQKDVDLMNVYYNKNITCDSTNDWCEGTDLNTDGKVDLLDLSILGTYMDDLGIDYHKSCSEENDWCDGKDIDRNGIYDLLDLSIIGSSLGSYEYE